MRSSPKPSLGHGDRDSTYSVGESIELPLVARELLSLSVDDVRGRVLHEALVREHAFGASDLLAQTLDLRPCVAVGVVARANDRLEDTQIVTFERNADSTSSEDLRRFADAVE